MVPKSKNKEETQYRLSYDYENPFLISFANKIAEETLAPHTDRLYRTEKSEYYIRYKISWWNLPNYQTTSYKNKKRRERERKRKKAGIVYKDKRGKKKAQQVYIIQMADDLLAANLYKIGISNAPSKRLQSLNTSSPFELELIHTFVAEPAEEAETKLHQQFEAYQMSGEWFKLTSDQIIALKQIREYRDGEFIENSNIVYKLTNGMQNEGSN